MEALLPTFFVAAAGLCLLVVLLALWHSLRVVLDERTQVRSARVSLDATQQALTREKDALLASIRELRFEHELGKVGDVDLQRFEQRYKARAREVLRMLDEQLEPHRDQANALIAKALGDKLPSSQAEPAKQDAGAESARAACPSCSTGNEPDAVFCKKCGARLQAESQS